ncbi:teicoplanin resistance protein VanZ [Rubrivivax gelatinosus]|nr:teicoplanin resistance protein VanZ [Rubrivivax gelatinosus]
MANHRHRSSATPLALAFAALIAYASLFPFEGWRWPPGQEFTALLALSWPRWVTPFDDWSNFVGYVPLGALVLIAARRSGLGMLPAVVLGLVLPAALSYGAEVTQQFLPSRHPSLKDWVLNTGGAALGVLIGATLHAAGLIGRWHTLRERWFVPQSAGALALLALWPLGLLFPAPVPLGLGQIGERLRLLASQALEDVPWADAWYTVLAAQPPEPERLWPPAEAMVTGLGLLAPCLVAYAVAAPGWRRAVLALGALALAAAAMTLSTLLNFGPDHALAWLTPTVAPALLVATGVALLLAPVGRRLAGGLGLVALTALVALVAQAPADPYFAQSLQSWEQGRFVRFHGLAQWIGLLWPYAAMGWLLARLASRE